MDATTAGTPLALPQALDRAFARFAGVIARSFVFPIERLHPAPKPAP